MKYWPHQDRADAELDSLIEQGANAICLTSPTGGGKSIMMLRQIEKRKTGGVVLYTNRKMLREQLERGLTNHGVAFGVRASGCKPALLEDVQLSAIQTEDSRVYKRKEWQLHKAKLVIIDEAHNNASGVCERIIKDHQEAGAAVVGFTATPLGIGHVYKNLVVAGVNSELRECGAHVLCHTYAPDEPDTRKIKPQTSGEYTENDVRKVIMTPTIFGRVLTHYKRLNPDQRPSILFAPGVKESIWFAEQFCDAGISAAHIDGDSVWINGEEQPSTREIREQVMEGSRDGSIKVICNRFVLREGIDAPWLYHCIFATVFGSPTSYLQSGGRLLRSHPSLDHVVLQDHGGNWWRHGSLNSDREWFLDRTDAIESGLRAEKMREKKEKEPSVCPNCGRVRLPVKEDPMKCQACGHRVSKKSRMVVQLDGTLKETGGDIFKPRRVKMEPNTADLWREYYWRAKRSKNEMTFRQAEALFFVERHYYPPRDLPLMPKNDMDWFAKVKNVNPGNLIPAPPKVENQPLFGDAP